MYNFPIFVVSNFKTILIIKNMKKIILFFVFLLVCNSVSAQFGVSYQLSTGVSFDLSTNNKIGINYNFNESWWVNLGLCNMGVEYYMGMDEYYIGVKSIIIDATIMYNLVNTEKYSFYIGFGGYFDTDHGSVGHGVIIPIGVEIKPFKATPNFSFVLEAKPMYGDDMFFFYSSVGVRYRFGK